MPLLRWRACALAPALFLAACGQPTGSALMEQRAAAMDPPQLWLAEALDAAGAPSGAVHVCTNQALRAGLVRANVEVNGQACNPRKDPTDRPGLYAVRCEIAGRPFGLTVNTTGDLAKDFKVRTGFAALYGTDAKAVQTRHYRKLGPCPAGWRVGDQGPPGGAKTGNALGEIAG